MTIDLPPGWLRPRLADIADLQLGKMLDKAKNLAGQPMPYLRNVNVRWGTIETSDLYTMRFTPTEADRFSIRNGDVLVCEGGEPGRCAVWTGGATEIKFQKAIHRLRPSERVMSEWIVLFLRHEALHDELTVHFTGTTIKHLPAQALAALRPPLPPLAEQRRIVARIEALFARTRRARTDLERITPLSRKHRNRALSVQINGPADGSSLRAVHDLLTESATNGISVRGSDDPPGTPALRLDALTAHGLDMTRIRYIPIPTRTVDRLAIREGDFLVSRGNGSLRLLAKGAFAREPAVPTVFPDTMIRLRFRRDCVHPGWLMLAWDADAVRLQIEQKAKTTAGIWKVSQSDLASIRLNVPNLETQRETAHHLQRQFTATEAVVKEAARALALLDRLEQSILARAFRGELVAQAPADSLDTTPPIERATPASPRPGRRAAA